MCKIYQGRAGGVAVLMDLLDGSRQFLVAAEDRYGLACGNSRPSSLPARVAFREKDSLRNATRAGSKEGRLFSQARYGQTFIICFDEA